MKAPQPPPPPTITEIHFICEHNITIEEPLPLQKYNFICQLTFLWRHFVGNDRAFLSPSITPRTCTDAHLDGLTSQHDVTAEKDRLMRNCLHYTYIITPFAAINVPQILMQVKRITLLMYPVKVNGIFSS